jgi:hypothetical protein
MMHISHRENFLFLLLVSIAGAVLILCLVLVYQQIHLKNEMPPEITELSTGRYRRNGHSLTKYQIRFFNAQGLEDPPNEIDQSLRERPEFIPYKGVLGGTMHFQHIFILNDKWVYATFEDGHIGGSAVFEYAVGPRQAISWKLVSSKLN